MLSLAKLSVEQFTQAVERFKGLGFELQVFEEPSLKGYPMFSVMSRAADAQFFYNGASCQVFISAGPRIGENVTEAWDRVVKGVTI